jgi:hypothetical protein
MPHRQATAEAARRKALGAWYTPPALVDHLVEATLPRTGRELSVLDLACGDGRFLAAARGACAGPVRLTGVDLDPDAVQSARAALPGAEILEADALTYDWSGRHFDVVLGNPPYRNQLARMTSRGGRSSFGGGPYADTAAEFLALSMRLAHPHGGRVGLVLPQSLLTTRDAAAIRADALRRGALASMWSSPTMLFDASVRTCALVFELGGQQGPISRAWGPSFTGRPSAILGESWGRLLLESVDSDEARSGATVGDIASFTVDFREQYYGLVGAVSDDGAGPPLVTSGLIDPGRCWWGERPVRFAKQRYDAPRVDVSALSPRLQRWAVSRLVPKILVANQTRGIEAVLDRHGEWLPSVPVLTCTSDRLDDAYAVLSSPAASQWVLERAAGSGLSADTVRLTPSLLASIPLL